jgi:hypothetical protein
MKNCEEWMWKNFYLNVFKIVHKCINFFSRKDLPLKQCKTDILLITGVLSSYANVVEKLHRDLEKSKATLLKIERAGDVLLQAVSSKINTNVRIPLLSVVSDFLFFLDGTTVHCRPLPPEWTAPSHLCFLISLSSF